ncbi:MAG: polysulfide reductase NrfD, partial [Hyphomicrobiales bacterium]|nr:polysulfide reductase NrfD [Hyphomicrobiales bacterium]
AVLYFTAVQHLTNLYATQHHGVERFLLADGGIYPAIFWFVQIGIGTVLPLVLLTAKWDINGEARFRLSVASILVLIGGVAQIYVIIIGGQAYPLDLFPGMEVSSSFGDGAVGRYIPSMPEILLGVMGVSIAMLLSGVAFMALRFLPQTDTTPDKTA